jgi:hypothetical protein
LIESDKKKGKKEYPSAWRFGTLDAKLVHSTRVQEKIALKGDEHDRANKTVGPIGVGERQRGK